MAKTIQAAVTHTATLGGETVAFNVESFQTVMDALVARHPGAGIPRVVALDAALPVSGPKPLSDFDATVIDEEARVRIEGQREVLAAHGVVVDASRQFFATGTRMAAVGYETQEARRIEHDAKTLLLDAAHRLTSIIQAEKRADVEVSAREFADAITVNGTVKAFGKRLREQAIRGLLGGRLESPSLSYVLAIRDRMVTNVRAMKAFGDYAGAEAAEKRAYFREEVEADKAKIADVIRYECMRSPDARLKLRTRDGVGDIFAVVSTSYAPADAPKALVRLLDGLPSDAKGSFAYDAATTTWELRASVWTPTPVAEQAVGEPFEGYASFWSKDDGTVSFRGGGGVVCLRCLNASTFSANTSEVRRRHVGDVLGDVKELLAGSLLAIDALCEAWGLARKEEVRLDGELYVGMPASQLVSGIFLAELRNPKGELAGVLPGKSVDHARNLATAYASERRDEGKLVRADFGHAWTRYVQDQPAPVRREAEGAIGSWLVDPKPIRYQAFTS